MDDILLSLDQPRRAQCVSLCTYYLFLLCLVYGTSATTDPGDVSILRAFEKGLKNPSLLKWPPGSDDPCGPPRWPNVFCSGSRVSQIQVQSFGLEGPLPANFNSLTELQNLGLQSNKFTGPLPSFSGLSKLQYAYLGSNAFDSIPADFFTGLTSVQELSLERNPLNASSGWRLPTTLAKDAPQLQKLFLTQCGLVGPIPDVLGSLTSLSILEMAYNTLSGPFPASFNGSQIRSLVLNNQLGDGLSGPLDEFATMLSLEQLWLHGNQFSGVIPSAFANCVSLKNLKLNGNKLVGPIPPSLGSIPSLQLVAVENNMLTGPIPALKSATFSYSGNSFCQGSPGVACSDQVTALLNFLLAVNYPVPLSGEWKGNDPCDGWLGVSCDANKKVSVLNLQKRNLTGSISPSLSNLSSLIDIRLGGNKLVGIIPTELTRLKSLRSLDVSSNDLQPPIPAFAKEVKLYIGGNPSLDPSNAPPSQGGGSPVPNPAKKPSGTDRNSTGSETNRSKNVVGIVIPVATVASLLVCSLPLAIFCHMKKKKKKELPTSTIVVHPRDPSDIDNAVKIVIANNSDAQRSTKSLDVSQGRNGDNRLIESDNLFISVQVLRAATKDFAPENEIGQGGFGVVYKGELDDGTLIAVKRMQAASVSNKASDEFRSEIEVLSKVRHRHLVSLMGHCVEGNERLLVYEYMPQGALSNHIFHWQKFDLQPLTWKNRLIIALDVARGMEYLHSLAHQSFIHRDLKSSNILLGDDFRAKVADFGLVKLAPDDKGSVATKLAGTFGYLAPEYAVTGKITTKADVFSFGVVLMELVTGLKTLDEGRSEESRYLVQWFWQMKTTQEALHLIIDPALDVTEDTIKSISMVAELARHCTAREPDQRPDMSHAVNVLWPLIQKWKPCKEEEDDDFGRITDDTSLLQMVELWEANEGAGENSWTTSYGSNRSIPARPVGFAESFTSSDGR